MVEEIEEKKSINDEGDEEVQANESKVVDETSGNKLNTQNLSSPFIEKETLIATAVHFLQNTKVKNVPLSQKRTFLLRKGLTNEDIDTAIERVNTTNNDTNLNQISNFNNNNMVVPHKPAGPVMVYQQPFSLWYRWREFGSSLMVIGATFYSFYYLFKRYIEPLILGKRKQEEDRMSKIERHLMELNKSLSQLRHSLVCVESTLCKPRTRNSNSESDALTSENETNLQAADMVSLSDMRGDITTIKSLLLSRKQFPAAPTSSLSIPTWQLKQQEEAKNDNSGSKSEEEMTDSNSDNAESAEEAKKSDEEFEKVPNLVAVNGNVSDH